MCRRRAFLFLPAVRQSCGVSAWHGPHSEHDLGWRSAADADDLCHRSGFQGSALAIALTNSRKHARPRIISPRPAQWWGQHYSLTHFDCSVFKQQVMGFPRMSCHWPLFRDGVQDLGRAGWRHARTTSELSYHWHQVGWRCHVFILWEFNSPFRKDHSLCRCREAEQISAAGHTSFWACQENLPVDAAMSNKEWSPIITLHQLVWSSSIMLE